MATLRQLAKVSKLRNRYWKPEVNFLLSPVLELFQSSALLRYRARYLGYIFVYTLSWDSEIYKLDHHISGSSFTLDRCSPLSKVQRQHFIEKTMEKHLAVKPPAAAFNML